jgi:hypothetical protein
MTSLVLVKQPLGLFPTYREHVPWEGQRGRGVTWGTGRVPTWGAGQRWWHQTQDLAMGAGRRSVQGKGDVPCSSGDSQQPQRWMGPAWGGGCRAMSSPGIKRFCYGILGSSSDSDDLSSSSNGTGGEEMYLHDRLSRRWPPGSMLAAWVANASSVSGGV